jgi:hypothetical protein
VLLLACPYALMGPSFHADDFSFLRNSHFDGPLHAAQGRQIGRPGAVVMYDLTFGLIGPHPLTIYVVQTALWVFAALAVLFALRQFLSPRRALAITLVWLVVPTHTALEHWSSTTQAFLALGLVAFGIGRLAVACDGDKPPWLAFLALTAAVASYEVIAGLAVTALFGVPLLRQGRLRWDVITRGGALLAVPLVWAMFHRVYVGPTGRLDFGLAVDSHLALGLEPFSGLGQLLGGAALAGAALAAIRLVRARPGAASVGFEHMSVAGLVIIVIGILPLLSFSTNFYGMDDRLTVVSGVGAAMIWVGLVGMTASYLGRRVIQAAVLALIALVIPLRAANNRDWVDSGRAAKTETQRLARLAQESRVVEVAGPLATVGWITGLHNGWNATAATQLLLDRRDVVVDVIIDGKKTGP